MAPPNPWGEHRIWPCTFWKRNGREILLDHGCYDVFLIYVVYIVFISVSIGFVSCTWKCLSFVIIVNVEIRSPLSSLLLNIEIQEQKHQFKNLTKNSSTSPRKQGLLKPLRQRIDEKLCSAKMPSWHGTSKKRSLPKSMDPSASGDATGTKR